MSLKLNWKKLRRIHNNLIQQPHFTENTKIKFIIVTADKKIRKSSVILKDFMNFMWTLSDNRNYKIINLVVQDEEGRILYIHKTLTAGNEEIPLDGNIDVVKNWHQFDQKTRETYIRLMETQIQAYGE